MDCEDAPEQRRRFAGSLPSTRCSTRICRAAGGAGLQQRTEALHLILANVLGREATPGLAQTARSSGSARRRRTAPAKASGSPGAIGSAAPASPASRCESLGLGTYIPGNEEHHAFFELVRDGHRIAYAPGAVVEHPYPDTFEAMRAAHVRKLIGFAGYVVFLLAEEPQYRGRVLRYLAEAMSGKRRDWRTSPSRTQTRLVPRRVTLLALLQGPIAYARSRRAVALDHSREATL